MRWIATAASALLLFQAAGQPGQGPAQQQRQNLLANLEGLVLQAGSGEPLAKAQVNISRVITPPAVPPTTANPLPPNIPIPPATTDAAGRFTFTNLEPGSYRITAGRNGFVRMNYGERFAGGTGTILDIPSGQTRKDVTFRLVPTAAVSGRIRESSGDPAAALNVALMKIAYSTNGQRNFQTVSSGRTDDHGEYRMFWISPGRYYLAVSGNRNGGSLISIDGIILTSGSGNEIGSAAMATVFYPGTVDPLRASIIEVGAGRDVSGVDIVLPQQVMYRVRGRVIDASGQPPRSASISLIPRDSTISGLSTSSGTTNYNSTNGTFDLRDVVPGAYWIRAQASEATTAATITPNLVGRPISEALTSASNSSRSAAQMSLDVANDVEGVVLNLSAGTSVSGTLRVEGPPLPSSTTATRVALRTSATNGLSSPLQPVNPDGTFTVQNIFPGEYRVYVTPIPQDYYLKEARIEQADVLNQPWIIGNSIRGNLEIVVSSGAGQIDGTVIDGRAQPVSSLQAWLFPDQDRGRTELIRSATTDQNGRFTMRSIPPGNYKLFAWEGIEANSFFDPQVMQQYEQQGKPVRITEGAKLTPEVKVIPARQQ